MTHNVFGGTLNLALLCVMQSGDSWLLHVGQLHLDTTAILYNHGLWPFSPISCACASAFIEMNIDTELDARQASNLISASELDPEINVDEP